MAFLMLDQWAEMELANIEFFERAEEEAPELAVEYREMMSPRYLADRERYKAALRRVLEKAEEWRAEAVMGERNDA